MEELKPELVVDDEEVEPDSELQTALARARRLRQAAAAHEDIMPKVPCALPYIPTRTLRNY